MDIHLRGDYHYNIDDKSRISVPAQVRHAFKTDFSKSEEVVVLTRGVGTCIYGFPIEVFDEYVDTLPDLDLSPEARLRFSRGLYRYSADCSIDKQGRMKIPQQLLEFARLTREAVIYGHKDHIEIWNPTLLDAYEKEKTQEYDENKARMDLYDSPKREKQEQNRKSDPGVDPPAV